MNAKVHQWSGVAVLQRGGLTLSGLAQQIGYNRAHLSRVLNGKLSERNVRRCVRTITETATYRCACGATRVSAAIPMCWGCGGVEMEKQSPILNPDIAEELTRAVEGLLSSAGKAIQ